MKQPCRNCPFRTDRIFPISSERRKEIANCVLNDGDFPCHKTFDTKQSYAKHPGRAKRCTGAAIFLENVAPGGFRANLIFRLAMGRGELFPDRLDRSAPVAKTYEEFVQSEIR